MGKITLVARTSLLIIFLFGSSLSFLTANNTQTADITISGTVNNISCHNGNDGSISASISGGVEPYSITWSNLSQTTQNISNLNAGSYTITVTDSQGSSAQHTFEVSEPSALQISTSTTTMVSCNGESDGSIQAGTVEGGTLPYQYSINGTFTSNNNFPGLPAGNYTITIKDSNGCIITQSASVEEPPVLTMETPASTSVSCFGGNDGTITTGTVAGGNSGYEFSKDGTYFTSSNTFNNLSAGTYNITVRDSKGCTISKTATVDEPSALTMSDPATTPVSCFGGSDGTITVGTVAGGNSGYEYSKDGINFTSSNTFSNLSAGNYTITVKDSKGCTISKNATVIEPVALTMADPTSSPVSCNGGSDGTITAGTVAGGNSGYFYSKDGTNFSSSNTFSNISAGNYTITVKDSKGCTISKNATVIEPVALTMADPTSSPVSCNGGSDGTITAGTVAGGNSGYFYSKDGTNFSSSNTFNNLSAGAYTITVKDSKGCIVTKNATVNEPSVLVMAAPNTTHVSCNGGNNGTITAGAVTGGNSGYVYSMDGTTFTSSNTFSNLSAGNYTITVKDVKGCTETKAAIVNEPPMLTMASSAFTPVSCNGVNDGTITAGTVTGGTGNYLYSRDGVNFSSSKNFSGLPAGTYTITVRDANFCEASEIVTLIQPAELTMTEATSTSVSCFGGNDGTVTAGTVSGGNGIYQYSIDNTNFTTAKTFTGLPVGTQTIFVKDEKGCSLQKTITVTEPKVLNATVTKTNVSCFEGNDGKIVISNPTGGSGNFEFRINEGTWVSASEFTGLTSGNYQVQIRNKDAVACIVTLNPNLLLSQPSAPISAELITTRTTTYGTPTGSATANPVGGTPGYTYEWRRVGQTTILQTTKTATSLLAGDYELTVRDTKGCTLKKVFTIIDAMEAFIISRNLCEGDEFTIRTSYFEVENGKARGGVGPYTYQWDFGTAAVDPLRAGIGEHRVFYNDTGNKVITLTITDSTGEIYTTTQQQYIGKCYEPCGKSENIEFNPDNIYIGNSAGEPLDLINNCIDGQDKYIYLAVSKSANAYNPYVELVYVIKNTLGEVDEVTTTFVSGCRLGDDIDDDSPSGNKTNKIGEYVRFTQQPIDFTCGDVLEIENFYITWTNVSKKTCGQNNNAFCYSTADPVTLPTPLKAEATATPILCKGDASGIITVKVSGGFAPYAYNLTDNNNYSTNNKFINLPAGDYTVYVRDARENKTTATVSILEPTSSVSASTSTTLPACFGEMGAATVTATGGTPFTTGDAYHYLWNDPAQQTTATATGLPAGNYTVTVIDANGCQTIESVTITEPEQLSQATAGEDQIYNCGFTSAKLNGNVPETGIGTWTLIAGTGGEIAEPSNANSSFTGPAGSYTLRWTIANVNGNCGTFDEVVITFNEDCSTLDFDGLDDYVTFGDNYSLSTGNFTLEAWVKPESLTGIKTVLSKRNLRNFGLGGYDLILNNGAPTFRFGNSAVSTSSKVGTSRWYHIAVIFKDSRVNLYVDGLRVGNSSATNPANIAAPFIVGAMNDGDNPEVPQNFFDGWIEEVRIWQIGLTEEQLRFMMNQRIEAAGTSVKGSVLPINVPNGLTWDKLSGYYQLIANEITNGFTPDKASNKVDGELKNILSSQENTAPLPYTSAAGVGTWRDKTRWARPTVWEFPNANGINGEPINWNIAKISHDINSGASNIYMLGLISESGKLTIANPSQPLDEKNSGHSLTVTHYLKLNGNIDLVGESQLIQTDIGDPQTNQTITSILDESSSGFIQRAQQGTANSFNYNYWSSPVSLTGAANNSSYTIKEVMLDGSPTENYGKTLSFESWHEYADGPLSTPRKVSSYWLHKFRGTANVYSEWKHIGSTGTLNAGEGYTMKGTSGQAAIEDRQNYVFRGKPNNGTIRLNIQKDQNYLLGNPYPSAIDVNGFILDNLNGAVVNGGTNTKNVFNGAVYFWDHFAGGDTHILLEYIGGYATRNLLDGVPAIANDYRVNANGSEGIKIPGQFIPVAQGFFINSVYDAEITGSVSVDGGDVLFKNSQRAFMRESSGDTGNSIFLRPEEHTKQATETDTRPKIRLDFRSPMGYYRQILVGVDANASNGFDLGYDALMNDYNLEDMFWIIGDREFVIQGVPDFGLTQIFPLGIRVNEEGEVMIKINELKNIGEDVDIFLKDKLNKTYYDLRESEVKITLAKGELRDRFEIVFQKDQDPEESPDPDEGKTDPDTTPEPGPQEPQNPQGPLPPGTIDVLYAEDENKLRILNPNEMNIQRVEIYNLLGQRIEEYKVDSTGKQQDFDVRKHPSALYVVKVFAKEGMASKNILLME